MITRRQDTRLTKIWYGFGEGKRQPPPGTRRPSAIAFQAFPGAHLRHWTFLLKAFTYGRRGRQKATQKATGKMKKHQSSRAPSEFYPSAPPRRPRQTSGGYGQKNTAIQELTNAAALSAKDASSGPRHVRFTIASASTWWGTSTCQDFNPEKNGRRRPAPSGGQGSYPPYATGSGEGEFVAVWLDPSPSRARAGPESVPSLGSRISARLQRGGGFIRSSFVDLGASASRHLRLGQHDHQRRLAMDTRVRPR